MSSRHGELGFTLLEALVGLAILPAMLIVSYSTASSALRTAFRVAERKEAVQKVQELADMMRRQPSPRRQFIAGETNGYRWHVSMEAIQGTAGHPLVPIRIMGRLVSKGVNGRPEIVVDTVILGQGG